MFDVGFLELVVIMVLGLLVLGPERLPKAAQKVGYWFGKARRYVEGMKSQVEAEFDGAEVKRLLHNQEVQIRELQDKITETESYIDTEYHNQFDDADDPGTSPEIAEETKPNELAREPQYDIIEEDEAWADDSHSSQTLSEQKQSEFAQQTASANQPGEDQASENEPSENQPSENQTSENQTSENQSADNHASGNKAQ